MPTAVGLAVLFERSEIKNKALNYYSTTECGKRCIKEKRRALLAAAFEQSSDGYNVKPF